MNKKIYTREEIEELFSDPEQKRNVMFTKVNGTVRTMYDCTIFLSEIPKEFHPKQLDSEGSKKTVNSNIFRVFETNVGWRSFRIDSVIDIW